MVSRTRNRYRVVAVSLYEADAQEADRCTEILRRAGWPKANRSLVIREAVRLLEEALSGKDDERVFRYFVERYARRAVGHAKNASPEPLPESPPASPADLHDDRHVRSPESSRHRH